MPTTKTPPIRTRSHHAVIHRASPCCWTWTCTCGSGIHSTSVGLSSQREALIAGLVHVNQQAAA